jgi:hypothetical protein
MTLSPIEVHGKHANDAVEAASCNTDRSCADVARRNLWL